MVYIKKEQLEILKDHITNIESLVKTDNLELVLDSIDDLIVARIRATGDETDEEGIVLQRIYDEIYNQNY